MNDEIKKIKEAVELFRNEPGLLERLLETVGDALFVVDADRNIVFWNKRAQELTGYDAHEVVGRNCLSGIRCETCLYNCALFELGEVRDVEVTLRTKDGGTLYCTKNAFVLNDENGQIMGAVEFLRDETQLVQQIKQCSMQRQKIEEKERLQNAVLTSIKEGVITIDRDFVVTSLSPRGEELIGRSSKWAVGRFCHEVIGSELCQEDCPVRHCLETEDLEAERTTEISTPNGKLPIAEISIPLRSGDGEILGSALIIEDRSDLIRAGTGENFAGMIGRSESMRRVYRVVEQVSGSDITVLITGESGTGKEMVARALHNLSKRKNGPFQAINCAALPEALLESEMFGHVRGAFTGAVKDRAGRIEEASRGTLFLDELGEMPLSLQAKLLRFLQEREYQKVGESKTRTADVRIVAATNKDLQIEVAAGRFREDLYYRVNVIPIPLPPLRERIEDIPLLAMNIMENIGKKPDGSSYALSPAGMNRLMQHSWPGNVRELINVLEYATVMAPGKRIMPEDMPPDLGKKIKKYHVSKTSPKDEARIITDTLEQTQGNRSEAARLLGMNRVTLYRKMKKLQI